MRDAACPGEGSAEGILLLSSFLSSPRHPQAPPLVDHHHGSRIIAVARASRREEQPSYGPAALHSAIFRMPVPGTEPL